MERVLIQPASQKSKDLNEVWLLLHDLSADGSGKSLTNFVCISF